MRYWTDWVIHPIKCTKEKNKEFEEKEKIRVAKEKLNAESNLKVVEQKMLKSLCAVNNKQNCFKECTHFQVGRTEKWEYPSGIINWSYYSPKCKLWHQ